MHQGHTGSSCFTRVSGDWQGPERFHQGLGVLPFLSARLESDPLLVRIDERSECLGVLLV